MPTGTRVDRCFQKLKETRGASSAAAICQSSTGQNLHTGKPLKKGIYREGLNREFKLAEQDARWQSLRNEYYYATGNNAWEMAGVLADYAHDQGWNELSALWRDEYQRQAAQHRGKSLPARSPVVLPRTRCSKVLRGKCDCDHCGGSAMVQEKALGEYKMAIRCKDPDEGCPVCHGNCRNLATVHFGGDLICRECAANYRELLVHRDAVPRSEWGTVRPVRVRAPEEFRVDPTIRNLVMEARKDPSVMPILADALEERGYPNKGILRRLREQDRAALQYLHVKSLSGSHEKGLG